MIEIGAFFDGRQTITLQLTKEKALTYAEATIGLGAYLVLSRRSYFGMLFNAEQVKDDLSGLLYSIYLAFSFVIILIAFLLYDRFSLPKREKGTISIIFLFVCLVGSISIFCSTFIEPINMFMVVVGIAAFALGSVYIAYAWAAVLASIAHSVKDISFLIILAFLVSAVLSLTSSIIPSQFGIVYVLTCPLLSFASLLLVNHGTDSVVRNGREPLRKLFDIETVFFGLLFLICSQILGSNFSLSLRYSITPMFWGTHVSLIVVCIVLLGLVTYAAKKKGAVTVIECIGLLLFMALFFFSAILDSEWIEKSANVVACTRLCFEMLLWILFFSAVLRRAISLVKTMSVLLALRIVSDFLVNLAVPQMIAEGSEVVIYRISIVLFFIVSLAFLVTKMVVYMKEHQTNKDISSDDVRNFDCSCKKLANVYSLSNRESEILELVARGYSSRWIAESLCISISTVQSHTKSIYRKMDIHTKQELIELVNS